MAPSCEYEDAPRREEGEWLEALQPVPCYELLSFRSFRSFMLM